VEINRVFASGRAGQSPYKSRKGLEFQLQYLRKKILWILEKWKLETVVPIYDCCSLLKLHGKKLLVFF